jgi:homeobox protein cut-like
VEELQQRVRVLQAVWAVEGDEDARTAADQGSGDAAPGGRGAAASSSLEAALLAKCRRLEHELTMARLRIGELSGAAPRYPWQHLSLDTCSPSNTAHVTGW